MTKYMSLAPNLYRSLRLDGGLGDSYRVKIKKNGKVWVLNHNNRELCEKFLEMVREGSGSDFIKEHELGKILTAPEDKALDYKQVEKCIRSNPYGSYVVRVSRGGRRFELTRKTLKEARELRDEIKEGPFSEVKEKYKSYVEGKCTTLTQIVELGKKLRFEFNQKTQRLEVKINQKGEWRTASFTPSKTEELRNLCNAVNRRIKTSSDPKVKRVKRELKGRATNKNTKNKQQDLF